MSNRKKAAIALIIANVIWGASAPIFKWALNNISPFTLAFFRFGLSSIIIFPLVFKNLTIQKEDLGKVLLLAVVGIGIHISSYLFGLTLTPSINAPIIASSGPVFLIIASIFFLHEKPKKRVILGTLISLFGVLIIIIRPFLEHGFAGSFFGNLLILLAVLTSVLYVIISKQLLKKYSPTLITFWSFLIGAFTFLPFFLHELKGSNILFTIDYRGTIGILYGVLLCSTGAYLLYQWGIAKIKAQEIGIFTYLDPIAALAVAIPLLGEVITPIYVFGSIFVFSGIFVAQGKIRYYPLQDFFQKANHLINNEIIKEL